MHDLDCAQSSAALHSSWICQISTLILLLHFAKRQHEAFSNGLGIALHSVTSRLPFSFDKTMQQLLLDVLKSP